MPFGNCTSILQRTSAGIINYKSNTNPKNDGLLPTKKKWILTVEKTRVHMSRSLLKSGAAG